MKNLSDLLLLGDPQLYFKSEPIFESEIPKIKEWVEDLHHVMNDIRRRYGFGRGIAAPQLGVMKQLIYINIDRPLIICNPVIEAYSKEMMELWDDCMCFPHLLVKVKRHCSITLSYKDENLESRKLEAEDDLSELIQHEYDHLHGILCTMRAIDNKSFKWRA
jgi:peptide deformylase